MPFEIVYNDQPVSHHVHTHVYYELLYVLDGVVIMTIRGRDYRVEAGSLVFLNQFDEHATHLISDHYRRYYLLIPPTQLNAFHNDVLLLSVFRLHGDQFSYVLPTGADKPRFDTYFAMLKDAADRGGPYLDERIEALMTLILTDAQALRPDMFTPVREVSFLPVQDILDELDKDFTKPLNLQALAARFHVSPGCLSAHFRRQVGMSPMQYVTQSRLNRAKILLSKTELSVMEVAQQCGFGDVSNFVRRFRQQFQLTPLQFRRHTGETIPTPRASSSALKAVSFSPAEPAGFLSKKAPE